MDFHRLPEHDARNRLWTTLILAVVVILACPTVSGAQDRGDLDREEPQDATAPLPDLRGIPYTEAEDRFQSLDVFLPAEPGENRPAVVFVHGGGFRKGTKNTFRLEGDLARQRGWVGFSINYRLDETPGHPAEMNDVRTAVAWVRDHADEYGVDPTRIALWGTSAGASLAALAGTVATGPLTEGDRVTAVVGFSGPMELFSVHAARNADTLEDYLGCSPTECPDLYAAASATSHVSPDDPPMFLAHSEDEGIPVEVTTQLADLLGAAGVDVELEIVPGSLHARALSLRTPGLMDQAFDFLAARFSEAQPTPSPGEESGVTGASTSTTTPSRQDGPEPGSTDDGSDPDAVAGDESETGESTATSDGGGWFVPAVFLLGVALVLAVVIMAGRRRAA